jgi:hypothetical protein
MQQPEQCCAAAATSCNNSLAALLPGKAMMPALHPASLFSACTAGPTWQVNVPIAFLARQFSPHGTGLVNSTTGTGACCPWQRGYFHGLGVTGASGKWSSGLLSHCLLYWRVAQLQSFLLTVDVLGVTSQLTPGSWKTPVT